ncbi:polysaccharide deacetylase family protein [Marinobacter salsuginis]|jgi:peptidoglycan/xylan/chitin deacetylase (PgdA/CDA1 family)|uniref:polysaccharide deacetylase family protein n=1 Tax=Marinobacter salsuginis TaxID=418719 RepID=UPI00273E841F|nr:polysaccharide deacetylase family protein [Marinobacter salsuginis]
MVAKLVISLDFELMWGVRDHRTDQSYGDAVLGGRKAIPEMLKRFSESQVKATWATVGLLFARTRDEMLNYAPDKKPGYVNSELSPYEFIHNGVGANEQDDPLHFGRSLVDQIANTEDQELATHTYSHYYCLEPGQTVEDFSADIESARAIAADSGHSFKSIVFPRNQMRADHVEVCREQGIAAFRGNPPTYLYRPRSGTENTLAVRGIRLLDGVFPVSRSLSYRAPAVQDGVVDVRASRFLRPWNPKMPLYSKLHVRRVKAEMEHAARSGDTFHLWWHPHNMGRNTEQNLKQLDEVLAKFRTLRDQFGMESVTMAELA